jgi:hypothetical protein
MDVDVQSSCRMLCFIRFVDNDYPEELMHGVGLDTPVSMLTGKRVLWEMYNKSVPSTVQMKKVDSVSEMLKIIFVQGLNLPVVDSYVDDNGETVFIVMGSVVNVHKVVAYLYFFKKCGFTVDMVFDIRKFFDSPDGNFFLYSAAFDDSELFFNLKFPHVEGDFNRFFKKLETVPHVVKVLNNAFLSTPEYVNTLMVLSSPKECAGMFSTVKNIVADLHSEVSMAKMSDSIKMPLL